jgi:hypothetical protein
MGIESFSTSSWRLSRRHGQIKYPRTYPWSCRLGATWKLGGTCNGAHDRYGVDCSATYATLFRHHPLTQDSEQRLPTRKILEPKISDRSISSCMSSHNADCICATYRSQCSNDKHNTLIGLEFFGASCGTLLARFCPQPYERKQAENRSLAQRLPTPSS